MAIIVVTRHQGALDWLTKQGIKADQIIQHLNVEQLNTGDTVIGTLPIPMVAQLNAKQIDYWHLSFEVPFELRGQELSVQQLEQLNIQLQQYQVTLINQS